MYSRRCELRSFWIETKTSDWIPSRIIYFHITSPKICILFEYLEYSVEMRYHIWVSVIVVDVMTFYCFVLSVWEHGRLGLSAPLFSRKLFGLQRPISITQKTLRGDGLNLFLKKTYLPLQLAIASLMWNNTRIWFYTFIFKQKTETKRKKSKFFKWWAIWL